jgi:hypothetical protein
MNALVTLAVTLALLPLASALSVSSLSRPERAANFLQQAGQRLGDDELLQLGDEARQMPGDLDKVKQMIQHMIVRHQEAQADDTDHKSFCNKEVLASKAKLAKLKRELEKRNADQDLSTAKLAELKDGIADLHESISKAHKDKLKASDLRTNEAEAYKQAKQATEQTLQTLKRTVRSEIRDERQAAIKSQEELTLKQVRADNKEEDAQFTMKKLDGELTVAIARKTKEVELKERKVVSMTHDLSLGDGDLKMAQEEMAAAKEYETKIKSSCTNRQDPVKDRKHAREAQMSSLKEAYGILTGDQVPTYR